MSCSSTQQQLCPISIRPWKTCRGLKDCDWNKVLEKSRGNILVAPKLLDRTGEHGARLAFPGMAEQGDGDLGCVEALLRIFTHL